MNLDDLYKKYTGHLYVRRSDVREIVDFALEEAAKVAEEADEEAAYEIRQLKTKE